MLSNTAVVVIDVQNALCLGKEATFKAMDIIANINEVIGKARQLYVPIIFIQHETKEGLFINGSNGWQLVQELDKASEDLIISKYSSDAFKGTELKRQLDTMEINHLVVYGMQSEFCVDSTIRRALALNYSITVVADGHTTINNEVITASLISEHHNCTWENITSYTAKAAVISASKIDFQAGHIS